MAGIEILGHDDALNAAALSQALTLRAYTAFALQAVNERQGGERALAGKLVLASGFGRAGVAAALGATLAGAACLGVDADAGLVKAAMREGGCDFMVNSLDEALRVLKNEVRKQRRVSVGVVGEPAAVMSAMVERGVQPDLLTDFVLAPPADVPDVCDEDAVDGTAAQIAAMRTFVSRGARALDLNGRLGGWLDSVDGSKVLSAKKLVEGWAASGGLELVRFKAGSAGDLRELDERLMGMLLEGNWIRRRWLELGGKYFRRLEPERWVWLGVEERDLLVF